MKSDARSQKSRISKIALRYCTALFVLLSLFPTPASAEARCFTETGQCIEGRFRAYWERQGGLPIFGLPLTGVLWEDGRQVQYFERNRFELHPENQPPFDVLLGQLGIERFRASGRDWQNQQMGAPSTNCRFFPETRHSVCGSFRTYWEHNGGLALFGLPISELMTEQNEADGQSYTVQYFERNRFELHPEHQPPFRVQLGVLGTWRAQLLFGNARQPHAIRAQFIEPAGIAAPFDNVSLLVRAPGYMGPAELRLVDGAGRLEAVLPVTITDGQASVQITASGALGKHAAALVIDGKVAGVTNNAYTLDAETGISTNDARYNLLLPRIRDMLAQDTLTLTVDGRRVFGYRSPDSAMLWLRDHVYQSLGFRYFERDMTSLLDYFRTAQHPDGSFDDYLGVEPDGKQLRGRMEVEADLEFLFAQGMLQAWQATGDSGWLQNTLPTAERGLEYATSDPRRWDGELGLIKRAQTIDMWDFEVGPPTTNTEGKPSLRHTFDSTTRFGIMHGDNTGAAYAMQLLARSYDLLGDKARATAWRMRAQALIDHLNGASWNGSFFRHFVSLDGQPVQAEQLSLSNAYALNRDVLTQAQATAILNEYQRRRRDDTFAEWFSLDPAFPAGSFGDAALLAPGTYVNGGIMPLVGGELARGAFAWGQEGYGFDILERYSQLLTRYGGSYLWYAPNGQPGISNNTTLASDGWGSSAMLAALLEGAAGVRDQGALLHDVELAPRWSALATMQQASVIVRYPASFGYVAYRWQRTPNGLQFQTTGATTGTLRLLLPEDVPASVNLRVAGVPVPVDTEQVGKSRYVVLALPPSLALVELEW